MSPVIQVTGIDLSYAGTGLAYRHVDEDDNVGVATRTLHVAGGERFARIAAIRDTILDVIAPMRGVDELVVIEGYSFASKGSATRDLAELGGVVKMELIERGIEYVDIAPPTLKKFATGNGHATKAQVISCATQRAGLIFGDDNQADAFWLYVMGTFAMGGDPGFTLPKAQMAVVDQISWPALNGR